MTTATIPAADEARPLLKLYEIPGPYRRVMDRIDEAGGELSEELQAELDALEANLTIKAERLCSLIRELETSAEGLKAEAKRLADLARTRENGAQRLKDYLQRTLEQMGERSLETPRFKLWIQNPSQPSVRWEGALDAIPLPFQRLKVELDAKAALEHFKATGELPEGFIVTLRPYLRIR